MEFVRRVSSLQLVTAAASACIVAGVSGGDGGAVTYVALAVAALCGIGAAIKASAK